MKRRTKSGREEKYGSDYEILTIICILEIGSEMYDIATNRVEKS